MKIVRAHIQDGVVVNLSVGDTDKPWTPPDGVTVVDVTGQGVAIGYLYDGKNFTAPPEPKPVEPKLTLEDRIAALEKDVTTLKAAKV